VGSISIDHDLIKCVRVRRHGCGHRVPPRPCHSCHRTRVLYRRGSEGNPSDGVYVLKNGCVCCLTSGAGSELERVLDKLCMLIGDGKFDYDCVVVEASGLADPAPIIQTFFRSALAKTRFYMVVFCGACGPHASRLTRWTRDVPGRCHHCCRLQEHWHAPSSRGLWEANPGGGATACVRDLSSNSQPLLRHLDNPTDLPCRRRYADVVILNKVDLVNEARLRDVEALVRDINATARLVRATKAQACTPRAILLSVCGHLIPD